eukprot:g12473.t1
MRAEELCKMPYVDSSKVYLTGVSMGGMGCWELTMQKPKLFAAIAPVAAYHKAYLRSQIAEALRNTPAEVSSLSTCFQINRFIEASVNFMPTIRQEAGFQTAIQVYKELLSLPPYFEDEQVLSKISQSYTVKREELKDQRLKEAFQELMDFTYRRVRTKDRRGDEGEAGETPREAAESPDSQQHEAPEGQPEMFYIGDEDAEGATEAEDYMPVPSVEEKPGEMPVPEVEGRSQEAAPSPPTCREAAPMPEEVQEAAQESDADAEEVPQKGLAPHWTQRGGKWQTPPMLFRLAEQLQQKSTDFSALVEILEQLERIPVTVDLLRQTQLGVLTQPFKDSGGWKDLIAATAATAEATPAGEAAEEAPAQGAPTRLIEAKHTMVPPTQKGEEILTVEEEAEKLLKEMEEADFEISTELDPPKIPGPKVGGTGDADELFGKTPRETPLEHVGAPKHLLRPKSAQPKSAVYDADEVFGTPHLKAIHHGRLQRGLAHKSIQACHKHVARELNWSHNYNISELDAVRFRRLLEEPFCRRRSAAQNAVHQSKSVWISPKPLIRLLRSFGRRALYGRRRSPYGRQAYALFRQACTGHEGPQGFVLRAVPQILRLIDRLIDEGRRAMGEAMEDGAFLSPNWGFETDIPLLPATAIL